EAPGFAAAVADGGDDDLPRVASHPPTAAMTTTAAMTIGTIGSFLPVAAGGTYAAAAGSAAIGMTGATGGGGAACDAAGFSCPGSRTGSGSGIDDTGNGAASEVDRRCMKMARSAAVGVGLKL